MSIIKDALDAQGIIQPGTQGLWQVFGARAQDIRPGDMVMMRYNDESEPIEFQVKEFAPRGRSDLRDIICPRFLGCDGNHYHIGALQPIVVMRHGTHHVLADSI